MALKLKPPSKERLEEVLRNLCFLDICWLTLYKYYLDEKYRIPTTDLERFTYVSII